MPISFIGTTIGIVAAAPATEDQSGYEALSFDTIGKIVSIGELGDEHEDISFNRLAEGRTIHVNGVADLGDTPLVLEYDASDAGQVILQAANGGNTTHSFKITDPDGRDHYFQGLIANLRYLERTVNQYKGQTFVIRGQSGITETA